MKKKRPDPILVIGLRKIFLVMRITVFLMVLGIIHVSASVYSQQTQLSVKAEKTNVVSVLQKIEEQSQFYFLYRSDLLNEVPASDVNFSNAKLEDILNQLIVPYGFSYEIDDRVVIIRKIDDAGTNFAQQKKKEIKGTVKDKEGMTMPGVAVSVKGTNIGISSDTDGNFMLIVPADAKTLVFSFVGMKTKEIAIGTQQQYDIVMEEDNVNVDEVVIVGYGTQKKASVIGSVDRVEAKQLKQPTRTISTSLAGRLAGIIAVQSSGEPGYDGASFWIRGVNTFAGNSTPLVLVDGVQRSIDNIDPEEIADFAILKDATATAIYGVRGANGVVLITTKKGTSKRPSVNLKIENSFTRPLELPEFVDGPDFMRLHNEANRNMGQIPLFSEEQIVNTEKGTDPYYYPNVNWMEELISPVATGQRATLNVSGGTESVRYFVSGAFLNQNGMWEKFKENSYNNNTNLKRYNFRTNIDMDITKTTALSVQIAGIMEDRNYPGASSSTIFAWMLETPPTKFPLRYPDKKKVPGIPYGQGRNPFQLLAYSGFTTEHHSTLQSNININQDLGFVTKGLRLRGTFAFDSYTRAIINRTMSPRPYLIVPLGYDSEGNPILKDENGNYKYVDQEPSNASYSFNLNRAIGTEDNAPYTDRSIYIETSLNYNRTFGMHDIGAMLLYNQSDKSYPTIGDIYESVSKRNQGLTGRGTYAYAGKYFAEFNFGYNGSENFAKGKRMGFFPSFAIGWEPTKESFMLPLSKYIQYMKLKLSYGKVGNDQIAGNRFAYITRVASTSTNVGFGTNNGYGYGSGAGINITYFGNMDASWEVANKSDLGLEINFLNDFKLQTDLFYEKRTDIWTELSFVPSMFGYSQNPYGNVGEMENKGIDGFLEYFKKIGNDLSINIKGTYTFAKNKVLATGEETPKEAYQSKIGQPLNRMFGYISEGLFIDEAEIANRADQSSLGIAKPGDMKFKDVNGDGKVDPNDRVYMGYSNIPEFTYGLGFAVTYKQFDFSILLQGAERVSFFISPTPFPEAYRRNVRTHILESRWTPQNQDINAMFPRVSIGSGNGGNYQNSSHWLRDGSYLRLKQMEIGYSIPKSKIQRIGIKGFRIYANGMNLLTFSKFKWWDPEARNSTGMFYPAQQVMNIGLDINF